MNNRNWKRLCKGEIKAEQVEIDFKECEMAMTKEDEGRIVKVVSIDDIDECRLIQAGDLGKIELYDNGMVYVLLKSGLAKGSIYCMNEEQLEVQKDEG
jgi:hypothetical protein